VLEIKFFGLLTSTQNIDTDRNGTDRDERKRGMLWEEERDVSVFLS